MSIHSSHIQEEYLVPMSVITRPFPSELDDEKVKSLMESIEVIIFVKIICTIYISLFRKNQKMFLVLIYYG